MFTCTSIFTFVFVCTVWLIFLILMFTCTSRCIFAFVCTVLLLFLLPIVAFWLPGPGLRSSQRTTTPAPTSLVVWDEYPPIVPPLPPAMPPPPSQTCADLRFRDEVVRCADFTAPACVSYYKVRNGAPELCVPARAEDGAECIRSNQPLTSCVPSGGRFISIGPG